jgi:broad specificity phosphatase PhoE
MVTRIFLVRHGEVYNPDKVLYGRREGFRLSDRGQEQAKLAAEFLAHPKRDIVAVYASPLQRAQETATPIAAAYGLPILNDERLIEAASKFEGTDIGANPKQLLNPKKWPLLRNPFKPSWGEPFAEQAARMLEMIEEARREYAGHDVVIVSHQSPIWCVRRLLEGRRFWGDPRRRECSLCSVTTLSYKGAGDKTPDITYDEPAAGLSKDLSAEGWSLK